MIAAKLIAAMVVVGGMGQIAKRPPELEFKKRVDYIAWWHQQCREGKTDNAFEVYKPILADAKGNGGLPTLDGELKTQLSNGGRASGEPEDHPELAKYLKTCEPLLAAVEQAATMMHYWEPMPEGAKSMVDVKFAAQPEVRDVSRLLIFRAWRKQDAQVQAILNATRVNLRVADHMQQMDFLIGGLVGEAIRNSVYSTVLCALDKGVIKGDEIPAFYEVLRENDPGPPEWKAMVNTEWAMCLDALQFACPEGEFSPARWEWGRFDPHNALELVEKHFVEMRRIVERPIDVDTLHRVRRNDRGGSPAFKANAFTATLLPSLVRAYQLSVSIESHRRATMIALALHAHHGKHGNWPEKLKFLDKDLGLAGYRECGKDPFSGELFKYRLVDGRPMLYTIGRDEKDNSGRHDRKWGESDEGGDFVFIPYHE